MIAERELRNQIAASEQARQMAEEASRLKDEFLATLSHEIRTPLNAVIGWTRILQTQPSVRSRAHALEVIERNAMSQMRLVEDLLDMARIISGKLRLKIDAVSLADVAQAAIDVVAPGAAAKKIAIETAFEPTLPPVSGDSERLQQVIWNLLSNALKFTEAGGRVRLEIARGRRQRAAVGARQRRRASRPISCRTSSIGSGRRTRRRAGATAGSASGCRWCGRSSSCTAAAVGVESGGVAAGVDVLGRAAGACRRSARGHTAVAADRSR